MPVNAEYVHVHTVTESKSDALTLAHSIIQAGIAASVQVIGPVTTITRWESAIEEAQEWQLRITTADRLLRTLERHISEKLRKDVAEFTVTEIVDGSAEYFSWAGEQLA